jgi:hypothetical protein
MLNVIAVHLSQAREPSLFSIGATSADLGAWFKFSTVPVRSKGKNISGYASYNGTSMATPYRVSGHYTSLNPGATCTN